MIDYIDYCNTKSKDGAMKHSGDMMTGESGKHTIKIDLSKISSSVSSFYIFVSSFGGKTLKSIKDAQVIFIDEENGQELCKYQHGDQDTGEKTSVLMAKMYRETPKGQWKVEAVAVVGMGRVYDRDIFDTTVKDFEKSKKDEPKK